MENLNGEVKLLGIKLVHNIKNYQNYQYNTVMFTVSG
jgi:hypothetical protein